MKIIFFSFLFLTLLWVKNIEIMITFIIILWIIDIKHIFIRNKKVFIAIVFFNTSVSIGYIIAALVKDISPWNYIIYINLKVYLLTYFVFLYFSKVSIVQLFSFSKEMSYLLTITMSQILSYKKTFEDFRLAYKSRVIKQLRQREYNFITKTFEFFFKKAMNDSKEKSLALKARGFFD